MDERQRYEARTTVRAVDSMKQPTESSSAMFSRATGLVHSWLRDHVHPGDVVLDATCGNGHDTILLAELCGSTGRVWALDVQQAAIEATKSRLQERQLSERVHLVQQSHSDLDDILQEESALTCAVFNLGYLPGSDKSVTTRVSSTLRAHESLLSRMVPGGVIFTTVYVGHDGGREEADALLSWAKGLDRKRWSAARHEWINQDSNPPFILIIQRRS